MKVLIVWKLWYCVDSDPQGEARLVAMQHPLLWEAALRDASASKWRQVFPFLASLER